MMIGDESEGKGEGEVEKCFIFCRPVKNPSVRAVAAV